MISNSDELFTQMEKFKNDYLINQGKNNFFKKTQKNACAKELCNSFNLQEMMGKTIYIIPNTNKILFDYTVFKLYAHEDNYETFVNYVIELYDNLLKIYANFETHIILHTFTVSAAERYKTIIQLFCKRCMNSTTKYSKLITKNHIYYTPSMMESIATLLKPFIDKDIINNILLISKADSPTILNELFLQANG